MQQDQRTGELNSAVNFMMDTIRDISNKQDVIMTKVATIEATIVPYMKNCDTDREEQSKRIDHLDFRISALDLWKERQAGKITGGILVAVFFGSIVSWAAENYQSLKTLLK